MVLINPSEDKKTVKVIRDHHQTAIANLAFLDWEKGKEERCE
jgi:hypothetical protein